MPHHDLKNLFGNALPKSYRTGECMPCNVCGERKGAAESQAYAFEVLIVFLIRGYLHLVVIPLQYLPCDRQDGRDKFIPCLYTMSINIVLIINGNNVLLVV